MDTSVFADRSVHPDERALRAALGSSWTHWERLRSSIRESAGPVVEEWKHYGARSGWVLKVLRGKRNLFFLTPLRGKFRLGFVFGDRAVAAVEASGLPAPLVKELVSARKYAEGRGLRLVVDSAAAARSAAVLVAVKVEA
jgi:hypothetical protein